MKRFIKLVFLFTSIMLFIFGFILLGLWGYNKMTGNEISIGNPIEEFFSPKEKKTILVAGLHPEGPLTDFIMVVQYNPNTKKVVGLSIPRDTKVTGTIDGKINSAYAKGRNINNLKERVKEVTSLSVDNYVIFDTNAMKKIVDAIGGVTVNVPIDMNYDDEAQDLHIHLKKGVQTLNGSKAEQFIRFRKNNDGSGYPLGDLQRIPAQQEFIKAAVKQLLNPKNILKIPELIELAFDSVKTDVSVSEALKYVEDIKEFNTDNLRLEMLPGEGVYINYVSYFGSDTKATIELVNEMFFDETPAREEPITIEVLNSTSTTGLAAKVSQKLKEAGYNVTKTGNYNTANSMKTTIINRLEDDVKAKEIKKFLGVGKITTETQNPSNTDITVILGSDY